MSTKPRHLLLAGAAAGPFFVVSSLLHAMLRTGFADLARTISSVSTEPLTRSTT
jgi:hypothetical protein